MNGWRVDAEGQRARRCATFPSAVAALARMAAPGVSWLTVADTTGWTDAKIKVDWQTGRAVIEGNYSWTQQRDLLAAVDAVIDAQREGAG